jgi:hypothetical protein
MMRKLEKARPMPESTQCEVQRNKVRFVCERIQDSIDPPRQKPLVGPVQLHHVHWKCTVYFTETTRTNGPNPKTTVDEDCQQVIYIDTDHLHRAIEPKPVTEPIDQNK